MYRLAREASRYPDVFVFSILLIKVVGQTIDNSYYYVYKKKRK